MTAYPVSQNSRTQDDAIEERNRCLKCKRINKRRTQAELLPRWLCPACRGLSQPPVGASVNLDIDIEMDITKCRSSIKILPKIPKRALIPFTDAYEKTLREAIEQMTLEKLGILLCFRYWSLRRPELSIGTRQPSLTTKVKQQFTDFIELSGIHSSPPERQFTNNNIKIDEHHYGKRVAAKFADGDIRGAVREISSSNNLAIHNEETLPALIAYHPPAPPNLLLSLPPDECDTAMAHSSQCQSGMMRSDR
ncbi:hypothetical protein GJ496_002064 [Pomphorhynchus laevis]|nr:hypothetical protein GJ496_002064 [Pomphorhynchus laevis]